MSVPFPPFKPDDEGRVFEKILWLAIRAIDTRGLELIDTDESAEKRLTQSRKVAREKTF